MSAAITGIAPRVRVGITYDEIDKFYAPDVDCRLLFLGDHLKALTNAYEEAARCLSESAEPAAAAQALESSAEIQRFYEIHHGEKISVVLRDSVFREQGPIDDQKLKLTVSGDGRSLCHPLPRNRFQALGRFWPLLGSNRTEAEIRAILKASLAEDDALWAIELLTSLRDRSFLDYRSRADNPFLRAVSRPRVTFMGHTSLLLQSERSAVLMDPLLLTEAGYARSAFGVQQIRLGAICCSHHHWDHCNIQSLMGFDKSTPIIIPRVERRSAFNPPMAGMLQMLGFTDIREARIWEPIQIEDIELIPAPFHGEQDEPGSEVDHYTYVLRTKDLTVYGGVDSFRDTFGETKPVMEGIKQKYRPNVAFLPISKAVFSYRYGGANGFCRYLDQDLVRDSFQYTAGPEDVAEWVAILEPRFVVPYAIFTFSRWTTPVAVREFHEALQSIGLGQRLYPLRPLDSLAASDLNGGGLSVRRQALAAWFGAGSRLSTIQELRSYRLLKRGLRRLWPA